MPIASRLPGWLTPAAYSTERETGRSRALWAVGWSTFAIAGLYLPAMMVLDPESAPRRAVTLAGIAGIALAAHWANRRGHLEAASWTFLALFIGFFTQRAWITGGLHAPIISLYLIAIMMGGLILGGRGTSAAAIGAVAGTGLLGAGEALGRLGPSQAFESPLAMFAFLTIIIALTVVLQRMVTGAFRASLKRAASEIDEHKRTQARRALALEAGKVVAWELDPSTGTFTADEGVFRLFDLDGDPGKPVDVARVVERIHTDDLPHFAERVRRRVDEPEDRSERPPLRFRIVRRDGSIRHAESASVVLTDPQDGRYLLSGVTADVTERRNAEIEREQLVRALGERVKELKLLHHVAQATQRPTADYAALLRDVAMMLPAAFQYPDIAAARATFGELGAVTPGWRDTAWRLSTSFAAGGKTGTIEVAYTEQRPEADEGPFLTEERALVNSVAEIFVAHINSMRSLHELEELVATRTTELRGARDAAESARRSLAESLARLQELEHLRDDLVKMIVHDMRGLLLVVTANLELARDAVQGQPRADIDDAMGAANEVNRMANTLLDVSRLEEGRMPMSIAACDVTELLDAAAKAFGALDASRAIIVAPAAPVTADCDRELIRRVIDNLLGNAIKHTPSGGTVRLDATQQGDWVRIAVSDEGPGIPEEWRQRIFEKFASTKKGTGAMHSAGLGLAFCRLAVEAHGGTIAVDPGTPRGSIFRFEIRARALPQETTVSGQ